MPRPPEPVFDRRRALGLLLAGLAVPSAVAAEDRRSLDLGRLREPEPFAVGARPHREGGVRLEPGVPLNGKRVVHHYGHGGAGITLAFGCAEEAAALVARGLDRPDPAVAVIGAGVIGLATADAVRRRLPGARLTVVARELDPRLTTSARAAGLFEPSGLWRSADPVGRARLDGWLRASIGRIRALGPLAGRYGIAPRDLYALDGPLPSFDEGTPRDVVPAPALADLPFGPRGRRALRYRTWLLDPPRLLAALTADLRAAGVRFARRDLRGTADVARLDAEVIVNCSGLGARALFDDPALVPVLGHLVRVERPAGGPDWFAVGGCPGSYVLCRHDDAVIGGTHVPGEGRTRITEHDRPVFERLLANAAAALAGDPPCRAS